MAQDSIGPDGRGQAPKAMEPEGVGKIVRASDDDDVEGHSMKAAKAVEPEGVNFRNVPKASDDDDVEGHGRTR